MMKKKYNNILIQMMALWLLTILSSYALAADDDAIPIETVPYISIEKYLGSWYEIARKPMFFQRECLKNVQATYTLNVDGNVDVENSCEKKGGVKNVARGEAFVMNAPRNSQLKVSFLPDAIRWLPIGRGDYWILKIDDQYQTALVGDPERKYLWLLSRTAKIKPDVWNDYVKYAKKIGYDVSDFNLTPQTEQ